MNKHLLFTLLSLYIFYNTSYTQENWCGFDQQMDQEFANHPQLENDIYRHFEKVASGELHPAQDRTDPIIIPVVFHVIHDNGVGDISYAQVEDGIRMLNEDFNRLNSDTSQTRNTTDAPFKPIASNVGVRFELAKLDPDGNCTNGVERRNSALGSYDGNDTKTKTYDGGGLDAWDRNNYFNIWVVNSIENDGSGTILGYAQFPMWGAANTYGVIIRHDRIGAIGTAASGDRTLTHEVGHCLGLYHTFQSGCGNSSSNCSGQGDGMCDTPPVDEAHWSCSDTQNNCSIIPNGDYYGFDAFDQYENFMSYSPCQNMFSEDQKTLMLTNLANINHLSNLVSLSNQTNTGVNSAEVLCQADFNANQTIICAGSTIDFSDLSYFGITSRDWSFTGGSPSTGSDSTVSVTYNTAGTYNVQLSVSDGNNTLNETYNNYITVLPNPGVALPYSEGFESIAVPDNANFFIENQDENNTWATTYGVSNGGDYSLFLSNYGMDAGSSDVLISGPIDLSILDASENLLLTFDYAYNKRNSTDDEWLKIYVSSDCGETWNLRKNIHGNSLGSDVSTSSYTPSDETEWKTVTISNITDTYYVSNFRYKFEFVGDAGNNIYIDNINLYPESWLSTGDVSIKNYVELYPNPSGEVSQLSVTLAQHQELNVSLLNVNGQIVKPIFNGLAQTGLNQYQIDATQLSQGIYFVRIETETEVQTLKYIVK